MIFFGFMSEERVEEGKWAISLLSGWGGVHVVGKGRGWKRKGGLGFHLGEKRGGQGCKTREIPI